VALDERSRHDLHRNAARALGEAAADTLMELLPPVGWADVATKSDLDHMAVLLRTEMQTGFSQLRSEMQQLRSDMDGGDASLRAEMAAGDASLRAEMAAGDASLRTEMHIGFAQLRGEMDRGFRRQTQFLMATIIASQGVLVAALKLLS
jgi:hypothetical protein